MAISSGAPMRAIESLSNAGTRTIRAARGIPERTRLERAFFKRAFFNRAMIAAMIAGMAFFAGRLAAQSISDGTARASFDRQNALLVIAREGGSDEFVFDCSSWAGRIASAERVSPTEMAWRIDGAGGTRFGATASVSGGKVRIAVSGEGGLGRDLEFPGPLRSRKGQDWVLPVNEGIMVPATDAGFSSWDMVLYGGHGLCMPFVGLAGERESLVAIAETPNDATVRFSRPGSAPPGRAKLAGMAFSFLWQPSMGSWAYERALLVVPLANAPDLSPHAGIAKAYRSHAASRGLVVTLKEKARAVPAADKLPGAVNLWYWGKAEWWSQDDERALAGADELKAAGVERVLWSHAQSPEVVKGLRARGFLAGRYDIYQDVWGPEDDSDWVNHDGWPEALVLLPDGSRMKGWVDRKPDGRQFVGGVICSSQGVLMEKRKVPEDLATTPYGARFIDTVTASPLRECYNPSHPLTRSEDLAHKMEMLDFLWRDMGLVAGSETGFDAAVPHLHYFEGMTSLGPYRLKDSGYDLASARPASAGFKAYQVGPSRRIPLFQLVYHDCVATSWYWGDSSNRLARYWDERDLINALYGTMPLWIMDRERWARDRERFVESYRRATPVARATGYSEMLDHRFVTADKTVQSTSFADGTEVWANWGKKDYALPNGDRIPARGFIAVFPDGSRLSSKK